MKKLSVAILLTLGMGANVYAQTPTCIDAAGAVDNPDVMNWYWQNCSVSTDEAMKSGAFAPSGRRADTDVQWSSVKTTYAGTVTSAQFDAVASAFNTVFAAVGSQNCWSFDSPPGGGTTSSFASPPSSTKGFCRSLSGDSSTEQLTFGTPSPDGGTTPGTLGTLTMKATSESTGFGTLPKASPTSSHTLKYLSDTMSALTAANATATEAVVGNVVTQLFICANAASQLTVPAGCAIGDATTGGQFAVLKISPTTGSWSLISFQSVPYK